MGAQQIICNNSNILAGASVTATVVAPSGEITATGINRQGTGLVQLEGLYTGHVAAQYDVEIVTGDGNGRASSPSFAGVGSGSLVVTAADIPAQTVTVTLLTPPYPGATAEARIGADIVKAAAVGSMGNAISIQVDRSALVFTPSGASTLEAVAEGEAELTGYKWDIPGIVCTTDQQGNVPADAPRIRFGTDPVVYRIVRDSRSGELKTTLTPAAVRAIPAATTIHIVTGSYSVSVTDGVVSETYSNIISGYDLLSALLSSSLVQPAYTPAPVTTPGGNAVTDIPLTTGAMAILTESSSAAVRPESMQARSGVTADTITLQCKGNGAWSVSGAAGGSYPDALEGEPYAPAASPVILTIPAKPRQISSDSTPPVYLDNINLASRGDNENLPRICVSGILGKNAQPKTITATYTKRPNPADCPCPDTPVTWSVFCLGMDTGGEVNDMGLDPAYQSRLIALYEWQKEALGYEITLADKEETPRYVRYKYYVRGDSGWEALPGENYMDAFAILYPNSTLIGTYVREEIPPGIGDILWIESQHPDAVHGDVVAIEAIIPHVVGSNVAGIISGG